MANRSRLDASSIADLLETLHPSDSECGGDSDAEDALPLTSSFRSGDNFTNDGDNSSLPMDFDSDDNIDDPDYDGKSDLHHLSTSDEETEYSDEESESDQPTPPVPHNQYNFSKVGTAPKGYQNFSFSQPFGPNVPVDLLSPLKVFLIFFTEVLLMNICIESNKYAVQKGSSLDLTSDELKAFIGMLIIMGFHPLPSLRLFWSTNQNFRVARIADIMPVKRFLKILRFIHLNDNSCMPKRGEPNYDKLYKVRPLVNHLNNVFKQAFNPSRFLSVDESMVAFKGRSSLKQYMPLKPIKRGYKVFVVCCAMTGFMLNFKIYEGKEEGSGGDPLGERVVMEFGKLFEFLGYSLFFDRFFCSIPLLSKLLSRGLFGCGTILSTRKFFPKFHLIADSSMQLGESDFAMAGDISVSKWKDRGRKSVIIASNMHNPEAKTCVNRRNKKGQKEAIECPLSVFDYNQYMGGVDKFDQLHSNYNISWKSRRGWMKLFYYMIDSAIVNSFILYKKTSELAKIKSMSHLQFRSLLSDELIGNFSSKVKKNNGSGQVIVTKAKFKVNKTSKDGGGHLPIPSTCRRCAHCSTRAKPKRSKLACCSCKVALCKKCFEPYHTNV